MMPEVAFLNELVGPDGTDQFVPGDKRSALVDQNYQNIERLGGSGTRSPHRSNSGADASSRNGPNS
jgi:hypothetical protein